MMPKKRILIAVDELTDARLIKLLLRDYEVCIETNGLNALETARVFKPDLILFDMPFEHESIARQLQEDSVLKNIPLVMLRSLSVPKVPQGPFEIVDPSNNVCELLRNCVKQHLGD